jgi:hypothetical protein
MEELMMKIQKPQSGNRMRLQLLSRKKLIHLPDSRIIQGSVRAFGKKCLYPAH